MIAMAIAASEQEELTRKQSVEQEAMSEEEMIRKAIAESEALEAQEKKQGDEQLLEAIRQSEA